MLPFVPAEIPHIKSPLQMLVMSYVFSPLRLNLQHLVYMLQA